MERTALLSDEAACETIGSALGHLLKVRQPALFLTTVAMLAMAGASETRASPNPACLSPDGLRVMVACDLDSAGAPASGNSGAVPPGQGRSGEAVVLAQGEVPGTGRPSEQEPNWGERLSCELSSARLDIGLLQRFEHERERAEGLEQDLAAARRDVEIQASLATKAREDVARLKQAVVPGGTELQNVLQQERERAGKLEQDLAAARRDIEAQTALTARAVEETSRLKTERGDATKLQASLQQERERSARLEQDLATARRDVETQTALATKTSEEASRLRKAEESGAANLQAALQQEREQSARLERDLAAARRDVETQTALATKAGEEASRLKEAGKGDAATLQASLQQERERSAQLDRDLAAARLDVGAQTALAAKAGEEVLRQKLAVEAAAADLKQSRAKTDALTQELSQARSSIYAHEAQALKAGEEAAKLRQAAETGAASTQKAVPDEPGRLARLEQDLAAARSDVETQAALAAKATEEAARLKREREGSAGELQNLLQAARQRADRLEQDLAGARRDVESKAALVTKGADETSRVQAAGKSAAEDLQKERERSARLEQDLAAARRDVESKTALATKGAEETSRLQAAGKSAAADLQKERERSARLEQDLAASRRDIESKTALVTKAAEETSRLQATGKSVAVDLQKERERSARLEQDLAASRRDVESKTALVTKAAEETSRLQATGKNVAADLQKESERSARFEQDLAAARRDREAETERAAKASEELLLQKKAAEAAAAELQQLRAKLNLQAQNLSLGVSAIHAYEAQARGSHGVASQPVTTGSTAWGKSIEMAPIPVAERGRAAPAAVVEPAPGQAAEAAGLVARASSLLGQGDIGGARLVLERAIEMGSAQAKFALAETYDPLILAKWGTYGTRGDAKKAQDLYANAHAAGVKEAKSRFDALRR
ncbi:hypothetical protein [Bradyrhizobium sp. USDA 3364]